MKETILLTLLIIGGSVLLFWVISIIMKRGFNLWYTFTSSDAKEKKREGLIFNKEKETLESDSSFITPF
jgi:hypothetical protein